MTEEHDVLLSDPIADKGTENAHGNGSGQSGPGKKSEKVGTGGDNNDGDDDYAKRLASEEREANVCGVKVARGWNHNVLFTLLMIGVWGLSDSIWGSTVLVKFTYLLVNNTNTPVGFMEGGQGLASLFTALPVGWLADKVSRQLVIKIGAVGFIIANALTWYSVLGARAGEDEMRCFYVLCGAMVMWGISGGIFNGPLQALYADSTPRGDRSTYYTYLMICYMAPNVIGPIINIFLFRFWGDRWEIPQMAYVFMVGLSIEFIPALVAWLPHDRYALPENEDEKKEKEKKDEEEGGGTCGDSKDDEEGGSSGYCLTRSAIPYVLFFGDLTTALGSGMTVKFFMLFFENSKGGLGLGPQDTNIVYLFNPIAILLVSVCATRLAKVVGRVQVIVLVQVIGIGLLCLMTYLFDSGVHDWRIIAPIYVLRTGFMNCTYPLKESILMDFVPKNQRARWKSLDSVTSFGWCGSAIFGGILADANGSYSRSFYITAIIQALGTLSKLLLAPLVPIHEDEGLDDVEESSSNGLRQPLLGADGEASANE